MTAKSAKFLKNLVLVHVLAAAAAYGEPGFRQKDIFIGGLDGYHTFRIPSLVTTPKGTLLAFCEGRKGSTSDTGDIDIVLKRSLDGGTTWQPMQLVWDDGSNVCGNPCAVVDRDTGTVWLLLTHNPGTDSEREIMDGTSEGTRTVWVTKSDDDGETWSKPVEITPAVKKPDWTWYATGPGVGIRLSGGRLVVPCDFALKGTREYGSHVIYSDDHGETWNLGGYVLPKCNECQVVELVDGRLLLNMRSYHGLNRRAVAYSPDRGMTWSAVSHDRTLVEPVCQASILRYTDEKSGGRNRILFSNPASTKRESLTVRLSYDECESWAVSKVVHPGHAAYSCLSVLGDGSIACLYERGEEHPYEKITFAKFNLEWLTDGADRLPGQP